MLRTTSLAVLIALAPTAAFAFSCPSQIAEIDAALQDGSLSDAQMEQVQELRDQAEAMHSSGDHAGALEATAEAKQILGG